MPQSRAIQYADRRGSWMLPEAKSADLLYVSDPETTAVYVYSYRGGELTGMLTGFSNPQGLCADKAGDVFVTDPGAAKIFEYAHGGTTPMATLNARNPLACSIDNVTGNLAAANYSDPPSISVYKKATRRVKVYGDQAIGELYFCGYDGHGNLYATGYYTGQNDPYALIELPAGSRRFKSITLSPSQPLIYPGDVQWDGHYLVLGGDANASGLVELSISGWTANIVGTVPLTGGGGFSFWIQGKVLLGTAQGDIFFFHYPTGGEAFKSIGGPSSTLYYPVVSLKA